MPGAIQSIGVWKAKLLLEAVLERQHRATQNLVPSIEGRGERLACLRLAWNCVILNKGGTQPLSFYPERKVARSALTYIHIYCLLGQASPLLTAAQSSSGSLELHMRL